MLKLRFPALALAAFSLALAGCGVSSPGTPDGSGSVTPANATGRAMGGEQPISGATVQLMRVNTDGSAATNILTSSVTTDSNGFFTLTGKYSCTTSPTTTGSELYLTVTGGNSGAYSSNSAIALMAALGTCGSLTSSTFIVINEVTTVASVFALQNFIGATMGVVGSEDVAVSSSLTQSTAGMQSAFSVVPALVTLSQGTAVSTYANATIEAAKINTIANILTTCVNSTGGSICANLFAAVTPANGTAPADTIQAALDIAQNPTNNIAQIYGFQPGIAAPFTPYLSTQPYDWSLAIVYTLGASVGSPLLPYYTTSDSSGNTWVINEQTSAESLLKLTPNGQTVATDLSSTTLDQNYGLAFDTLGNLWMSSNKASSSFNNIIKYPGSGSSVASYSAPSSGSNYCQPWGLALDGSNNVWFTCTGSGYQNLYELPNTGTVGSPTYGSTPTQFGAVGTNAYSVAVDTTGNVWVANEGSDTISEFPAGFNTSTTATTYSVGFTPYNVTVDHNGNIWFAGSSILGELVKSGSSYSLSTFSGGGLNGARSVAIDAEDNIWVANSSTTTYNGTTYMTVSEFNNSGTALNLDNFAEIPGGFAIPLPSAVGTPSLRSISIDTAGNVWLAGCALSTSCNSGANAFVAELVGIAAPPVAPLSTAVAGNYLGCCTFTPTSPGGTVPTSAGYATLQASTYSPMLEGGGGAFLNFEVTRIGGSTGAVTVHYATSAGTAVAGTDYTTTSGTLTWSSGDSTYRTITVPWLNASNFTGTKTFTLTLSSPTGGVTLGPNSSETVSVADQVTSAIATSGAYPWWSSASTPFYLTPPSNYFTFSYSNYNWDIQLPIDEYGGQGGINQIQFSAYQVNNLVGFSDPYFYLNSSNQIVFTAPSNGAVTSPGVGTDDARSELRELYTGTGHDSNSDWYGNTDGGKGGTMTGTCAVTSVSADTDEVTFAQVHGQNNPFLLLIFMPASNEVAIQVETTSAATSDTRTALITGANLGDTISYSLTYSAPSTSAAGTVTVWAKDVTNGNSTLGTQTITIDSSWSSQGQYFKLGAYSGNNHLGNPSTDYNQTVYTIWNITH